MNPILDITKKEGIVTFYTVKVEIDSLIAWSVILLFYVVITIPIIIIKWIENLEQMFL